MNSKSIGMRFSNWLVEKPWWAILLVLVATVILLPKAKDLKSDFSYRIWFREGDPLLTEFDAFERRFGNDESLAIIMHSPSGVFDVETATMLREITQKMWLVSEVIRVDSLSNYNWVHADGDEIIVEPLIPDIGPLEQSLLDKRKEIALHHETLPEYLVSRDAQSAIILAQLKPALNGSPNYEAVVNETRELLKTYRTGDHQFFLTGGVEISNSFREATQADMKSIVPVVLLLAIVFLALFFRKISGVILPLLIITFSLLFTLATAALLDFKFNNLTSIIPQILVAVGMADAVHILATFYQIRATGVERKEATRLTLAKNFIPTILTSVTTAIGFFSFTTAKMVPVAHLGILAGIGTLYAWFITYFLLGPLLSRLPLQVKKNEKQQAFDTPSAFSLRFTRILTRFSRGIVIIFIGISIAAVYLSARNTVNSDPMEYFTEKVPLRIANRFMENRVGSALGAEMVIDSGEPEGIKDPAFLNKVEAFQEWLNEKPYITKTVSIIDILKQMNRSLHAENQDFYRVPKTKPEIAQQLFLYTMSLPQGMDLNNRMTIANDAVRLTIFWKIHDSKSALSYYKEFEDKSRELGLKAKITGKVPLYQQMNDYVVQSFLVSILIAIVAVSILLSVVFKSVKLGLLAMIPNLIPLTIGGALVKLTGQYVDIGIVLVASITLGIAVDDTIHFISHFRRLRLLGRSAQEAVAAILTHTAPALITTSVVLVSSFGSFILASFRPNQNFGILSAIVLMFALVADLTCLPALLLLREHKDRQQVSSKKSHG